MSEDVKSQLDKLMNDTSKTVAVVKKKDDAKSNAKTVIRGYVEEYIKAKDRVEAEKEHMKDIAKSLKEQHGIKPKTLSKVAKIKQNGSTKEFEDEVNEIEQLLEIVMKDN